MNLNYLIPIKMKLKYTLIISLTLCLFSCSEENIKSNKELNEQILEMFNSDADVNSIIELIEHNNLQWQEVNSHEMELPSVEGADCIVRQTIVRFENGNELWRYDCGDCVILYYFNNESELLGYKRSSSCP